MTTQNNKEKNPRFTVIIPNKNRAPYLHHTLRTCMLQNYEPLEVLVSDDGSTDNAREVVEDASRRDSRIRLISPGAVGMRDNFEFALKQAKPGFVIALGGDDGLLPGGIQGMRDVLRDTGMELLAWSAPVYIYPKVRGVINGQLTIPRARHEIKIIDSGVFLRRQATNLHYLSDRESPMLYVKGVASTDLIEKVCRRSADGRFFSCPTPDGYSGIVLAGEVSRYAFSGRPFTIYGASPDSQGLAYLENDAKARNASEKFYQNTASRPMHKDLASQPYSPLITLMTADYLLTVRDLPGWPGRFPPIDYRQLLQKGLTELAHGLYGSERIRRELGILDKIADAHGLGEYFRNMARRSRRYRQRSYFDGDGINARSIFLDGQRYNLHNIFDAAYALRHLYQAYSDLNPVFLFKIIVKSLMYRWRAMRKGGHFPPAAEWG